MRKTSELKFLRTIKTGKGLIKLINSLKTIRRREKVKGKKRSSLTKKQRELILSKTDSRCHMCGVKVDITNFQADHVQSHSSGGTHAENNYLPSCFTCNNYRWHYSSEEIQIILKLGVWLKTKITSDAEAGKELANQFVKHEMSVRKRKKAKNEKKK
ncbi:HNH endonuclease [Lacibacter sp. H407]|uniref:HNH endonuclease n=1 Tax=Lacibacter sp. H407 TaxID=3133423 RepID=UPI0030BC2BFB